MFVFFKKKAILKNEGATCHVLKRVPELKQCSAIQIFDFATLVWGGGVFWEKSALLFHDGNFYLPACLPDYTPPYYNYLQWILA